MQHLFKKKLAHMFLFCALIFAINNTYAAPTNLSDTITSFIKSTLDEAAKHPVNTAAATIEGGAILGLGFCMINTLLVQPLSYIKTQDTKEICESLKRNGKIFLISLTTAVAISLARKQFNPNSSKINMQHKK